MISVLLCLSSALCQGSVPTPTAVVAPSHLASVQGSVGYTHSRTVVLGSLSGTLFFNDAEARRRPLFGEMTTNNPSNRRWENGRFWISTPRIGPNPTPRSRNWEEPGPLAYGAPEDDSTMIYVLNGAYLVSISPWDRLDDPRLAHLEAQRNRWLYERGYVGGVRTFVNDAYAHLWTDTAPLDAASAPATLPPAQDTLTQRETPAPGAQIEPRGVIAIPPDMPRFRKRMDVRRSVPHCAPVVLVQSHDERRGVDTVTGRGNSWTPTRVVPKTQDIAAAKSDERATEAADGV